MRRTAILAMFAALILVPGTWLHAAPTTPPEAGPLTAQAGSMGILKVDSNVPGAAVLIDGQEVGVTPLMTAYEAGTYQIEIQMLGYEPHKQKLVIPADKKVVVRAELELVAGTVVLNIKPDGCTVELDGEDQGTSPDVSLDLVSPGSHSLRVTKDGYETFEQTFELKKRQELTLTIALEANSGVLVVNSVPDGAKVFADGDPLGATPLRKPDMPSGLHSLRLTSDGRADAFLTVDVRLGEETSVNHVFKKEFGGLKVIPEPTDSKVVFDRYPLGKGEINLETVEPGVHKLRLSAPKHLDYYEDVLVKAGKTTTVRASLTPTGAPGDTGPRIKKPKGNPKKAVPVVIAIVGAVTTGTVIAIAAANTEGPEPDLPPTDYLFQLP